jgi:tetratricopeptide (TPR) repeat protein
MVRVIFCVVLFFSFGSSKAISGYEIVDTKSLEYIESSMCRTLYNKSYYYRDNNLLQKELEVYKEVYEKYKDSKNKTVIKKVALSLNNIALIISNEDRYKDAIEIYDIVISDYSSDKDQTTLALYNKAYNLVKLKKLNEAINIYNYIIKNYKNEIYLQNRVADSYISLIELLIITNKPYNDVVKTVERNYNKKDTLIYLDMLKIVAKSKDSSVDGDIKEYISKYQKSELGWIFKELRDWASTLGSVSKSRVVDTIDIFESNFVNK